MAIDSIVSSGASGSATASASTSSSVPTKSLGQDDFLKLLMAQLQNQDPLQPVDNQAFIAQLAQFSSLQTLQSLGGQLDTLLLAQNANNQIAAASLVGKQVSYKTDTVQLATAGQPASVQAQLSNAADAVTAVVTNANGQAVRTLALGARSTGTLTVSWDGHDSNGNALPAGSYSIKVTATRNDGAAVQVTESGYGAVQGVTFQGTTPQLIVGGSRVNLSDVVEIDQPPSPTPGA